MVNRKAVLLMIGEAAFGVLFGTVFIAGAAIVCAVAYFIGTPIQQFAVPSVEPLLHPIFTIVFRVWAGLVSIAVSFIVYIFVRGWYFAAEEKVGDLDG